MLPPARQATAAGSVENFFSALRTLHTEPYLVREEQQAIDTLRSVLLRFGCKLAVLAGLPPDVRRVARSALAGIEHVNVEDLKAEDAVSVLAKADVGITWAEYGVAMQGAVMEVVYDDAAKLASSLPFNHIVFLSSKRLLGDLPQAMAEAGKIIRSSAPDKKPTISFISGPSKTGDIEMRLLYGVHGPNTLTVLVLDWL
jgi:L-lactate dehydrogenase complex protein LldG